MDVMRTQYELARTPKAPARSMRLFIRLTSHTPHDVDSTSLSPLRCRDTLCSRSSFPMSSITGRSNPPALTSDKPPSDTSPFIVMAKLAVPAPPPASVAALSFSSSFFVSCPRVIMHSTAILLIISVDVTGHTMMTRHALYSNIPSRSDTTKGRMWRKSRV